MKEKADESKRRTIEAFEELIDKYLNPDGHVFFKHGDCPLCLIHFRIKNQLVCRGCPLADKEGNWGCINFASFRNASIALDLDEFPFDDNTRELFKIRAEFFKRHLETIKKWDLKRFTPAGWKYSGDEIPRSE
jgi:hypothetical protein